MRLIDADALLEDLERLVHFTDIDSENDVRALITNATTVQREGWVNVPIEPTEEMLAASWNATSECKLDGINMIRKALYKAMLQAAPTDTEK